MKGILLIGLVALAMMAAPTGAGMIDEKPLAAPESATRAPLYERLGGRERITAVVSDMVDAVAADPRLSGRFSGANLPRLKAGFVEQFCEAAGGPCRYGGAEMKAVHAGMAITDIEFEALLEALGRALERHPVSPEARSELLSLIGQLRAQIVGQ